MANAFSGWSRAYLAKAYLVDYRLINNWLAEIDITHSRRLSPKEVLLFLKHAGVPNDELFIERAGYLKKLHDKGLLEFSGLEE